MLKMSKRDKGLIVILPATLLFNIKTQIKKNVNTIILPIFFIFKFFISNIN